MLRTFWDATSGYADYLWRDITSPSIHSYFYLLLVVSAFALLLERWRPWRPQQRFRREGLGLDTFYLFFNFFGFSLIGWAGVSEVVADIFRDDLGVSDWLVVDVRVLPAWAVVLTYLVARDLIHYLVHRVLHRVSWLWRVHQIHHSIREMGFAGHLRFHPLETVVYRTVEYIPLALFGFGLAELFWAHAIALLVGHLNHANLRVPLGPLRYVLNSPQMHLWHHARHLPRERLERHGGVNFGLTFSVWDWLFGTAHWPEDDADLELGFPGIEACPHTFWGHIAWPFRRPSAPPVEEHEDR